MQPDFLRFVGMHSLNEAFPFGIHRSRAVRLVDDDKLSTRFERPFHLAKAMILPKKPSGLRVLLKILLRSPMINTIDFSGSKNTNFSNRVLSSFVRILRSSFPKLWWGECVGEFNRVDRAHCKRAISAASGDAPRSGGGSWGHRKR